ncbi:ADP-ribosylation factor-like protein 2 [Parelaphostrongylus tenuis]|uniref:ADP-ribosylation factor-like protein 2 n=1 Tax=Parelaphostrongylus tenuis TaxID=148309 RepID=A0AAD5R5F5_PARTN|nr:ADP-ribosylation factor-like protein 2 [Parelaphostrongylus tenuis]
MNYLSERQPDTSDRIDVLNRSRIKVWLCVKDCFYLSKLYQKACDFERARDMESILAPCIPCSPPTTAPQTVVDHLSKIMCLGASENSVSWQVLQLNMGLLTILRKQREKEREIRVLILGLDNAGKTTVTKKFLGEDLTSIEPTLGFNIMTVEFKGFTINFWDVGGQKSLRSYWRNYFEQTDALIWVVDSGDEERLLACRDELRSLLSEERLLGASLLVLANKQDLHSALRVAEIAKLLELDEIKSHHWRIYGCSAITGENLLEAVEWMCEDVASRIFTLE